jgi:putative sugar O-methyltransferase
MKFNNIKEDLIFLKNKKKFYKTENIWEKRSREFLNHMMDDYYNVDYHFFKNFRSDKKRFIAENPSTQLSNFFLRSIYSHQFTYINFIYKKLKRVNKKIDHYLKLFKLDEVGNPGYCVINNFKLNERFLRHCHFFSIFDKFFDQKKISYVIDIGGGYGSFARLIHKKYKNIKLIIIDLPEQLIMAKYYLEKNFPNSKISNIRDIYKIKKINHFYLSKYNILLIPHKQYNKININLKKNLTINFNSFGEIDKYTFDKYMKSDLLKKSKYFFSVNRIDSFPTYNNNLSFLDYRFENYKKLYNNISPVWDYFFVKKFYLFKVKRVFTSRVLEFIGKNKMFKKITKC